MERCTKACRGRALVALFLAGVKRQHDNRTGLLLFSLLPRSLPHAHSSHKGALTACQTLCQTLHILISFNKATLWSKYYHPHCTQKETEAKPPASRWQRASFNHYLTLLYKSETCTRLGYEEGSFSRRLKGFLLKISTSSEIQYFRKRRKLALFWVFSLLNRKCSVRKQARK